MNAPKLSLTLAALAAACTQAHAGSDDQPIEELVVTGEFRQSGLMNSAGSISVLSLEEQRSGAINHLEEVLGWLPNVNFATGGSRARFVQIRGIGERGQFAEPLNPSVGLVLDGVDLSGVGVTATLFDVEQVEVLRGPQGTLYGANALAGLINVRTSDPTDTFLSRLRLDGGDYGAYGAGVVLSGPLANDVGYRLAVQQHRDDGFINNRHLGRDDTNSRDELTVRGKLSWTPREDVAWTITAGLVDIDNGFDAFSLDNTRNTLSDEPGRDRQETRYGSATLRWDINEAVSFAGTLGLSASDSDYGYDEDWAFVGLHPDGYSATDRYLRDRDNRSLDLRLLSQPGGRIFADTTDWVVGIYALDQSVDLERSYTFLDEDFVSRFDVQRLAVYGELEHAFDERTRLVVGLRAERHEASYRDSEQVRFDPVDRMYGGRLVLERDLAANALAYASVTRGYKAGGFNISGTLDADLREFDPETLWNYELGLKGRWLDGRLSARGAVFNMQRDDVQVDTSIVRLRDDGSTEFIDLIGNAAEGSNLGMELELDYLATDSLTLFANLGLLDTEFKSFINSRAEDMSGREQAHAPNYQFFVGAEYRFAPAWYLRVESEGKDSYYFSNSERVVPDRSDVRSDSYALWHASVGYEAERWSLKVWGRNLTDQDYATRGFYFGNDPRDGYTPRGYFQLGEPRRYGVTVTLQN